MLVVIRAGGVVVMESWVGRASSRLRAQCSGFAPGLDAMEGKLPCFFGWYDTMITDGIWMAFR